MKQATLKTIGAAALGAALASAAGTASAAGLDGVQSTAGDLVGTLPVESAVQTLPAGSGQLLSSGAQALKGNEVPLVEDTLAAVGQADAGAVTDTTQQLLGGLPLGSAGEIVSGINLQ